MTVAAKIQIRLLKYQARHLLSIMARVLVAHVCMPVVRRVTVLGGAL